MLCVWGEVRFGRGVCGSVKGGGLQEGVVKGGSRGRGGFRTAITPVAAALEKRGQQGSAAASSLSHTCVAGPRGR